MGILDRFKGAPSGTHTEVEQTVDTLVKQVVKNGVHYWDFSLKKTPAGKELQAEPRTYQRDVALEIIRQLQPYKRTDPTHRQMGAKYLILKALLRRSLPFTETDLLTLLNWLNGLVEIIGYLLPLSGTANALKHYAKTNVLSDELSEAAEILSNELLANSGDAECRKYGQAIGAFAATIDVPLVAGDVWADAARAEIDALQDAERKAAWCKLLLHCQGATGGKPTGKWTKAAEPLLNALPFEDFKSCTLSWLPLAARPSDVERQGGTARYHWPLDPFQLQEQNQDVLKGLAWMCSIKPDPDLTRALGALCVSAYKKVPGVGPRATRLGNACIYSLGAIEGGDALAQLALLKIKIKNRATQNQIAKALQAAADREGVSPEDLEEMSVPEYGLTEVGVLEEAFGDFTARLTVEGTTSTSLVWVKADGKTQKSVPASVKADHADELKELKAAAKDIQKMLPAVRERIDKVYLLQKTWDYPTWKDRYRDHPLTGTLTRRLIWWLQADAEVEPHTAIYHEGQFVEAYGHAVAEPGDEGTVRLWHPLDGETDEVLAWRNWLDEHLVQQPFKQAHREIYLLTDAERNTGSYSNRYAAHIIKQHQFNALCQARGWRNTLRLMVDDDYPPASKFLDAWGIRAEFWIEGIGDNFGVDTTETGTYLYLATDQVRFYKIDDPQLQAHAGGGGYTSWRQQTVEPMPLTEIPALVFSEIMRDVDLFVGVASVANDPNWSDGGPGGHHQDYWNSYSFGDLSASANTRKEILENLLPRLKIAKQSRIDGKFLIVEGTVRTYKIHLGSGNILMEPNDQYLCIVPNASMRRSSDKVFLPFEGDNILAIILSKAFLLADDQKIKDATILSQIKE